MNAVLWVAQGLLALAYLPAGGMKASQPVDALGKQMAWVRSTPEALVRFIGVAEVLGAIGIILPLLTNILSLLTVAAAIGLVLVRVFAIIYRVSLSEATRLPFNVLLLLLSILVV